MTTAEGNKLIAEFMGYKYVGEATPNSHNNGWWKNGKVTSLKLHNHFLCRNHKQLAYHFSWDWLMPVVEEIENVDEDFLNPEKGSSKPYEVAIVHKTTVEIYDHQQQDTIVFVQLEQGNSKIEAVYSAVIQFIEWYNKNQQP